ncbi:MAG TPA: helix-turn-helix transcriptional regulator [Pseudonocardia sp.]
MSEELSPYSELIGILDAPPLLVRENRRRLGLSLRAAAKQIGVADSTIHRTEQGNDVPSLTNAIAMLRWIAAGATQTDGEAS